MAINAKFSGSDIKLPGRYGPTKTEQEAMDKAMGLVTRDVVQIFRWSGGKPVTEEKIPVKYKESEEGYALVSYKSMDQLIKEFPNHFFDCHGNFCNGVNDHLAPFYFSQMGKTVHVRYQKETGIQDSWYYTVIDR